MDEDPLPSKGEGKIMDRKFLAIGITGPEV